jgi:uncharacterized protein (DUF433 family)
MDKHEYVSAPHDAPPSGPCIFCGYPDKRHRMWDMIKQRFKAGESIDELAADYGYTRSDMEHWLRLALTAPRRKKQA